jgi:hypothetical protein
MLRFLKMVGFSFQSLAHWVVNLNGRLGCIAITQQEEGGKK